jgi:hypothetical protein
MKRKIILLFFIFAILSVSCYARTFTQLVSDARLLARDPSSANRPRFTDVQVKEFINEGQRDAISDTLCIIKATSIALVADTRTYDLPTDYITAHRVTFDFRVIDEVTTVGKDKKMTEWEEVQGIPLEYYIDFTDRTKIAVYPFPDTDADTGTLRVDYYAQATDLSADSDVPFNSISEFAPFHKMLSYYAAARMLQVDKLHQLANQYMQQYAVDKSRFYKYCRKRPAYQPGLNVKIDNR